MELKLIQEYQNIKNNLEILNNEELKLRNIICKEILEDKTEGSKTVKTEDGYKLTATAKVNKTIDIELLTKIDILLTKEEKACITWKPTLKTKEYKALTLDATLHKAVTIKNGTSQLKIEYVGE